MDWAGFFGRRTPKVLVILGAITIALLVTLRIVVSLSPPREQTFSKDGFTITLTEDFYEKNYMHHIAYYESKTAMVSVVKDYFSALAEFGVSGDTSPREYADLIIEVNNIQSESAEKNDLVIFEYTETVSETEFSYLAVVFPGDEAFWLVQFCSESENFEKMTDDFFKWADSVRIDMTGA